MENNRKVKIISLIAVVAGLLGLTIAFASLSKTLKINGRGSVDPVNFDIYFDNLSEAVTNGQATTSGNPTLASKGATISNINATLKQPKDSVTYTLDIVNEGDVDAEISNITLPNLSASQSQIFEFTAEYTETKENGSKIISVGDMLYKNERKNITITFKYKDIDDESLLPKTPEEITLEYAIEFIQSNKTKTTTAAPSYGDSIDSKSLSENITATYYGGSPMAKANTNSNVRQMVYDNRVAENEDVRYSGGTLVISGNGPTTNYQETNYEIFLFLLGNVTMEEVMANPEKYMDENENPIFKYNPTNLVIGEGITTIGDYFLSGLSMIQNVSFPSTLTYVGTEAFSSCSSIEELYIHGNNVEIADDALSVMPNLNKVVFGEGVTTIGTRILDSSYPSEVYLSSSITQMESDPFYNYPSIVYCQTQAVADLFNEKKAHTAASVQVIVDASKFN